MPNWARGTVETVGTKDAILAFSRRFIASDDDKSAETERFFARSFLNRDRADVEAEIRSEFQNISDDAEGTYCFNIDFAWSAYCCIVEGYPNQDVKRCITLSEACALDKVDVKITTKEPGMYFEEIIECTRAGGLSCDMQDLKTIRCKECGNTEAIASFEDIEEMECSECGGEDFVYLEEDFSDGDRSE